MNSFEANKIFGAVLGTIFVLFGGSLLAEALFHAEAPEQPGYVIVAAEPGEGGDAAPAAAEDPPVAALLQTADVEAGASQFKKCAACHSIEKGGPNKVGPHLWDAVMRPIASVPDFGYSTAMQEFSEGGEVKWDYEHLYGFLKNPKGYIPGTAMGFAGLKKPEDRANLIAYMREQADSPAALPEAPAEAPAEEAAAEETTDAATTTQGDPAAGGQSAAQAGGTADAEPAPQPGAEQAPTMSEEERPTPPAADAPQDAGAAQAEEQQGAGTGTEAAPGAEENVPGEENAADEEAAAAPAEGAAGETQVAAAEPAAVSGDPEAGKKVFRKCQACHAVGEGAKNKVGPELNGIVGEAIAAVEGYSFSPALVAYAEEHPTWNVEELSAWLADPRGLVKGTKMVFPGLKKPEDVANVIAYLATFDENGATTGN